MLAALLLAWMFGQAISVADRMGITADEPIHLMGGYSYWTRNDYRMQPENGNFPQRWSSLPLLAFPTHNLPVTDDTWQRTNLWGAAHRFLYVYGNQPYLMVFAGRVMVGLMSVATGWLVFLAARNLFGPAGGLLATAVFAVTPSILANGALVTSDMAACFGFLLTTLTGWRLLHRVTTGRTLAFGFALGLLALAKFSAGLFGVSWAGILFFRLLRGTPLPVVVARWRTRCVHRGRILLALLAAHAIAVLIAAACIWAAFGFRYSATSAPAPTAFNVPWEIVLGEVPFVMQTPVPQGVAPNHGVAVEQDAVRLVVRWARDHRLLPEAYLYGFSHVYTYSHWRPAYFAGEYRTTGWWNFFPTLYLLKTPLPLLALSLLTFAAILVLITRARQSPMAVRRLYRLSPYLLLAALYVATAVAGSLNIGYRHLLPVEVIVCVLTGLLATGWSLQSIWRRTLIVGMVALGALVTWSARPDYLAYFNPLAGGAQQAYRLFADSTLDWGQGLPALESWLAEHPSNEPVYLAYFGWDNPQYRGMRVRRLGDASFDHDKHAFQTNLSPGTYVISATLLHGVYTYVPEPWRADHEHRYQQMLAGLVQSGSEPLTAGFLVEWDQIRFGRLTNYLRKRNPDAQPDPSLLVYHLTLAELQQALLAPP